MKWFLLVFAFLSAAMPSAAQSDLAPIKFEKLANGRLMAAVPKGDEIQVVDGDTLWVGIFQIRLFGIDAVEPKQPCEFKEQPKAYCHQKATAFLSVLAEDPQFRCEFHVKDGDNKPWINHGRYVATCYTGEVEVNREMVRSGWAFAAEKATGDQYKALESIAKSQMRGVHRTEVKHPAEWRRLDREDDDCTCK
jgi:endonuclease YncB( thermonuclease family)